MNQWFSCEFFPPKKETAFLEWSHILARYKELSPKYISVTYGALGAREGANERSLLALKKCCEYFPPSELVAHLVGASNNQTSVDNFVTTLSDMGISKILVLRGDIPAQDELVFQYSTDLLSYLKGKYPEFSFSVAGYPEGHPDSASLEDDLFYLRQKASLGVDSIVTQAFFDNDSFYRLRDQMGKGFSIVPGIMPLTSYVVVTKIIEMGAISLPSSVKKFLSDALNLSPEYRFHFALDYLAKQCDDLYANGVEGVHFFTMNQLGVVESYLKGK